MTEYRYSASNVFARMQSGQLPTELLFDRPHTFAMLDRSGEANEPAFIELGMWRGPALPPRARSRPVSLGHSQLVIKHPTATCTAFLCTSPLHAAAPSPTATPCS